MKVSVDVYMFGYLINTGMWSYLGLCSKLYGYIWLFVLWNTGMSIEIVKYDTYIISAKSKAFSS